MEKKMKRMSHSILTEGRKKKKNNDEINLIKRKKSNSIRETESKRFTPLTINEYFEDILFTKHKFKFSNAYDEKNSNEFLDTKNHYLKEVILSDKIEEDKITKKASFKSLPPSDNNMKYSIVVTNYDEEKEKEEKESKIKRRKSKFKDFKELESLGGNSSRKRIKKKSCSININTRSKKKYTASKFVDN